jgi:hypothetical protein
MEATLGVDVEPTRTVPKSKHVVGFTDTEGAGLAIITV